MNNAQIEPILTAEQIKPILTAEQMEILARVQKALTRIGELQNDINAHLKKSGIDDVIMRRMPSEHPRVRLFDAGRLYSALQNLLIQHDIRQEQIQALSALQSAKAAV